MNVVARFYGINIKRRFIRKSYLRLVARPPQGKANAADPYYGWFLELLDIENIPHPGFNSEQKTMEKPLMAARGTAFAALSRHWTQSSILQVLDTAG